MLQQHPTQQDKSVINGRQLCFFAAFLVPVGKLLTLPSILAYYSKGDLLFPALAHYLFQAAILAVILFIASRTEKSFFELLSDTIGNAGARIVYVVLSLYLVFSALIPLLDIEQFVYTTFFDTAPSLYAFAPFFVLSGFICTKNMKAFGRSADISMPLFLLSFIGLMIMSVGQADFSNLLPFFGASFGSNATGFIRTFAQFSDSLLFLLLIGPYRYKKGDGKKVMLSYGAGALFVLFFLAVFYGIFSSIATKQEFAFVKTAQYFQALSVVGRFDLILIYLMTVVLLFYYSFILQLSVDCFAKAIDTEKKVWISAVLNILLFLYAVYFNRYYQRIYYLILRRLFWIFPVFAYLLPLLSLLLKRRSDKKGGGQGSDDGKKPTSGKTKKEKSYA